MKKLLFVFLFALASMSTFANTIEVKPLENLTEESQIQKELSSANKDEKTVTCYIYVDGEVEAYEYSCFFCWGGAMNGCYAAGCQFYATCGS